MILSRDDILKADDLKRVKVSVPEWGGDVYVREVTGKESVIFDAWMVENKDDKAQLVSGWHSLMVMLCACDDKGVRLFSDDDLEYVKGKNRDAVMRIANAAIKLNKMGADDLEDEAKNSSGRGSSVSAIA